MDIHYVVFPGRRWILVMISHETFGARIRRLATARHMSLEAIAERVGRSKRLIYIWLDQDEPGITATNAAMLAEALHCSMDYLILGEESPYTGKHKEADPHAPFHRAIRAQGRGI